MFIKNILYLDSQNFNHYFGVIFLKGKICVVCGPYLHTSIGEEVDQMSTVCKKKVACF